MGVGAQLLRRRIGLGVFVYGTLAALLVAFIFYRQQGLVETIVDLNGFGKIARNLAGGQGFSLGSGPTTRRGPLYPFLGAGLLLLFGRHEPGASQAALYAPLIVGNCVAFGFTCAVVWRLGERLFGLRAGLLAAAICPLLPQCLRYVGMTEVETLMGLWTVLLAATGLSLATRPNVRTGAAFGAVAAAATLTKPVILLYPFVFLMLATWHWKKAGTPRRAAVEGASIALVCFAILLLPWTLRNMSVTNGHFKGISSNAPGEFLRGYVNAQPKYFLLRQDFGGVGPGEKWDPEANAYEQNLLSSRGFYIPPSGAWRGADPVRHEVSALFELDKDRVEGAEVRRTVLHEPFAFIRKFVIQLFTFWYLVETRARSVLVGGIAVMMLALAAAGAAKAKHHGTPIWPVIAVVVYCNFIYAVFLAFARYSMPLFPTLAALSSGGLASLADRLSKSSLSSTGALRGSDP